MQLLAFTANRWKSLDTIIVLGLVWYGNGLAISDLVARFQMISSRNVPFPYHSSGSNVLFRSSTDVIVRLINMKTASDFVSDWCEPW